MDNIYGVTLNEAFTADRLDSTCTINISLDCVFCWHIICIFKFLPVMKYHFVLMQESWEYWETSLLS